MEISRNQLKQTLDVLSQGYVCLDENLRQGVLVYIESQLIEQTVERDKYLSLECFHCEYPYARMGSATDIDFFDGQAMTKNDQTPINDRFKTIDIRICSVVGTHHSKPIYRWKTIGRFQENEILEAINALIVSLGSDEYFSYCASCHEVKPTGHLNNNACECGVETVQNITDFKASNLSAVY
ncbi:hypothetical protein C9J48_23540 [Photobacterium profundum]|uniref:Uncharacterized protein n=1 Tax=Photobacterium profundum 3TCK TaxID=314280 RepID=Q1Z8Z5_9GAMM|nr:hypothetical protein [Photobacterium profundum]EAS44963.1 hypothetical protein P3TCK_20805 [Photobacterium profundum 3TCK]PSV59405.1 hypothetical protein C9J48_23540 [Photobacterium profundum]